MKDRNITVFSQKPKITATSAHRGITEIIREMREHSGKTVRFEDARRMLEHEIDLERHEIARNSAGELMVHESDLGSLAMDLKDQLGKYVRLADVELPGDLWARDIGKRILAEGKLGENWNGCRINGIGGETWVRLSIHQDDVEDLIAHCLQCMVPETATV